MDKPSLDRQIILTALSGGFLIATPHYDLTFAHGDSFVPLNTGGIRVATLFAHSSVNGLGGADDTTEVGPWRVEPSRDESIVLSREAASSLWMRKVYRFRCSANRFVYEIEIEGTGTPTNVEYFGGYESWNGRLGSGFFNSGHRFDGMYSPEPEEGRGAYFSPLESATIDIGGVPLPGKAHWFFTPPPFCFCLSTGSEWHGLGITAKAGDHNFDVYTYHGGRDNFHLSLNLGDRTVVNGHYLLPALAWDMGSTAEAALKQHVASYPIPSLHQSRRVGPEPVWWREPIFCGWGEQCYAAGRDYAPRDLEGHMTREAFLDSLHYASSYATQEFYTTSLDHLAGHGIHPGTIVIDDKWQSHYGLNDIDRVKWPSLRGFIAERHAAQQHVLLWLKAWDWEGVPDAYCVKNAAGHPIAVDPTHPGMRRLIRRYVRTLLSSSGSDADGFKIDFTARVPVGPGGHIQRPEWGLELLHTYLAIIYDEAKRVKPDALIVTHTPHPYLAGCVDMIRLNDMLTLYRDVNDRPDSALVASTVTRRSLVAATVFPGRPIDTDNWPVGNLASWRAYLAVQPTVGVPSLYYSSHIDATQEALDESDYALISGLWRAYRRRLHRRQRSRSKASPSDGPIAA